MSNEEQIKCHVRCPTCNKSENIFIPADTVRNSGKGLTTVLIPESICCEHSFQIFVDKNGSVRGYETPDFELKLTIEEEPKSLDLSEKGVLQLIKGIFGEEIFTKFMRCAITDTGIFIITEQDYIKTEIFTFMNKIFGTEIPRIEVYSMEDYNTKLRQKIHSSENISAFVFNAELSVIIKETFPKKFKMDQFKIVQTLMSQIDMSKQTDEEIIKKLSLNIDTILKFGTHIKSLIENKSIHNKKELEKILKKKISDKTDIKLNIEFLNELLKHRCNFDSDKAFLKVDEKLDKLKSLF